MPKKKVLLMGKAHSGKTSMRSIIFANYLARDTTRLSATLDVEHHHVRFLGDLVLNLWDCGGQDAFYESYFERDRETIFRSVELLIYVFDIESESPEKDFDHFCGVLEAIEENSPDARIFVLVHKMDLVAEDDREIIFEDRKRLIEDSCNSCGVQNFQCFGTSIWDETLYKAWSEIVTNLIPNIRLLETHLNNFCRICDADEVVLFERATFLVISHAQATDPATQVPQPPNHVPTFKQNANNTKATNDAHVPPTDDISPNATTATDAIAANDMPDTDKDTITTTTTTTNNNAATSDANTVPAADKNASSSPPTATNATLTASIDTEHTNIDALTNDNNTLATSPLPTMEGSHFGNAPNSPNNRDAAITTTKSPMSTSMQRSDSIAEKNNNTLPETATDATNATMTANGGNTTTGGDISAAAATNATGMAEGEATTASTNHTGATTEGTLTTNKEDNMKMTTNTTTSSNGMDANSNATNTTPATAAAAAAATTTAVTNTSDTNNTASKTKTTTTATATTASVAVAAATSTNTDNDAALLPQQLRHIRRTSHFDAHRFEKISNIVKQFKLSCGKAQSQFQGMEVRNSRFSAFIDAFTANTYIMVIVSNPNVHTAATLLNIQNARNHFERFIPRI